MTPIPIRKKILVVAKTYPSVSSKLGELVCTAGITDTGDWIRIYPIDYRYQPFDRWYKKYQWIEVDVIPHTGDPRIESYRPNLETLKLHEVIDSKNKWEKRKEIIFPSLKNSVEELQENIKEGYSLGFIKPLKITSFKVESVEREWKGKQKAILSQSSLFSGAKKVLDKISYKFSYEFQCDDERCKGHKYMIEDWEISALYRACLQRANGDEKIAIEKVRQKYEKYIMDHDIYFLLGTTKVHHYTGKFVIICVFCPLK